MKKRHKKKNATRYCLLMTLIIVGLIITIRCLEITAGGPIKELTLKLKAKAMNTEMDITSADNADILMDFSVRLFQNSVSGKDNALISPLSVLHAVTMLAGGAEGETRAQMETASGFTAAKMHEYIYAYKKSLPEGDSKVLNLLDSVWLNETEKLTIEKDYLQNLTDYIGASVYQAPFDETLVAEINRRTAEDTNGEITEILTALDERAMMYLFSTLTFQANWSSPYGGYQVGRGIFTTEGGIQRSVTMLNSEEFYYISDTKAEGIIKYYSGKRYAFAALLPDKGTSLREYIASMSGSGVRQMLLQAETKTIITKLPKFQYQHLADLEESLAQMGILDAFDRERADLSRLGTVGDSSLYVEKAWQKTYIDVNEQGTSAGAVTVMEVLATEAVIEDPTYISFDRPFIYMIIDCEAGVPVFMGTVADIGD